MKFVNGGIRASDPGDPMDIEPRRIDPDKSICQVMAKFMGIC
jgi:hypothetical protein